MSNLINEELLNIIEGKDTDTGQFLLSRKDIYGINRLIDQLEHTVEATTAIALVCILLQFMVIVLISLPKGGC